MGGGNPQEAKMTAKIVMVLVVAEMVIVGMILFICHYVLGYVFNSEKEVRNHVANMVPFICLSIIMDGLLAVLSGNFLTFLSCKWAIIWSRTFEFITYLIHGIPSFKHSFIIQFRIFSLELRS